jgi:hypothetical protein
MVDLKFNEISATIISIQRVDGKEMINLPPFASMSKTELIDISSLAKGIYLLKVIHGNKVDRFRVVVY